MRIPRRYALAVLLLLVAVAALGVLRPPPAAAFAVVEEIKTPKGFTVWYVREPSIPVISMSLYFKGGSALDPAGKEGLARLAAALFDEGAGDMDSQAFQGAIINKAIDLDFNATRDAIEVDLRTLSQNRDTAFRLLGLALNEPRFDADAVERVRAQFLHIIRDGKNDPETRSSEAWYHAAFGAHPYGTPTRGTEESMAAIAAADLKAFAKARIARDNVVIGVAGDVQSSDIARLVDVALGSLPEHATPAALPAAALPTSSLVRIEQLAVPQSVVTFGMPGLMRDDPDFYIAYVMNYILGGGAFTSRLYQEVREKRGLAYSVYTYLAPLEAAALYMGGVATQNNRVAESIAIIRQEIGRLAEEGVTEEELAAAKRHLTGAFPLRFDSGAGIASMLVSMQVYHLGIDYFDKRNAYIEAVTLDDVARVAKRLLDPDKLVVVVAGDPVGLEATP
ncbi:MAG: M16 family metallopeptidase [Alphaproteobacteria bacterium]